MKSCNDKLVALRKLVQGPVFTAHTPGYDEEVSVFNMAVRHRPALVLGAANPADVATAVKFASRHGLNIAVLNTGHGPSVAADANTLMITTRRMRGIDINARRRTARIEAGVRFGELAEAAANHDLAPLAGSSPGVGVVGYTLSGGASSTMGRKYGWAADHVIGIDVVTADGQMHRVSAASEGDLFGALLGGEGNFGVVTAMEFTLFPVTRLYAGGLFYSGRHTRQVLEAYIKLCASAPNELTTSLALLNFPALPGLPVFMQGKLTVSLRVSFVGDDHEGARWIEPMRQAAPVLADTVAGMPYARFGSISDDPTDPAPAVEQFALLRELSLDTIDAVVNVAGPKSGSSINIVDIRHLQGAYSRPAPFPNAVGARDAGYAIFALTVVPPGCDGADYRRCGYELIEAVKPWLHEQTSPSFQGPNDTTDEGVRRAYDPAVYEKLRDVKSKYDPHNRFRFTHNIPPRNRHELA